jgi:NADH-quinone oxidoreductase subunit N
MIDGLDFESIDWFAITPLLILLGGALLLLLLGSLLPPWRKGGYALLAALTAGAAGAMGFVLNDDITDNGPRLLLSNTFRFDHFTMWILITLCAVVLLTVLVSDDYLWREKLDDPEIYALYLVVTLGGVVMAGANDFIVLFLGLEILSIGLYVLAASHRRRAQSQESGLKYFILGGFASAVFLYGVALIYGAAGSTNFTEIVDSFNSSITVPRNDALALAGIALLIVGLGFKAAAVPFHFWSPDVYQGAPTPVTGFMASAAKAAAFAAMLRVLVWALPQWRDDYQPIIWVLAALSLVVGSALAVVQTNVKRMLAYSSVAHAGFILVGVEAAAHTAGEVGGPGVPAVLVYVLLYGVLVVGTFAVVTLVGRTGDDATELADFRGLARDRPRLAIAMTVLLLAQAGVPLTSGFVAKFDVISAAVEVESYAIAVIAMVSAVIAAFLYLRIMISMWVAEPEPGDDAREVVRTPLSTSLAIIAAVAFTLVVGVFPGWLLDAARSIVTATP